MSKAERKNIVDMFDLTPARAVPPAEVKTQEKTEPVTKRTFKINDQIWADVVIGLKLENKEQQALINELLAKYVKENAGKIKSYKEMMNLPTY